MLNSQQVDKDSWIDVVVVDARPTDYVEMAAKLSVERMTFRFARSAGDALRMAKHCPQVVWMINISLPDMSGVELLSLLRGREPQVTTILVGEWYRPEDEMQSRECGSAAYVCKPAVIDWLSPWLESNAPSVRQGITPLSATG